MVKNTKDRRTKNMANRIILNPITFHGKCAINEIVTIAKEQGFAHVFVC